MGFRSVVVWIGCIAAAVGLGSLLGGPEHSTTPQTSGGAIPQVGERPFREVGVAMPRDGVRARVRSAVSTAVAERLASADVWVRGVVVDSDGDPVPFATVLHIEASGERIDDWWSDEHGAFSMLVGEGEPLRGTYFQAFEFEHGGSEPVPVDPVAFDTPVRLVLGRPLGVLAGAVRYADGSPAAGVHVHAARRGGGDKTALGSDEGLVRTDGEGRFALLGLAALPATARWTLRPVEWVDTKGRPQPFDPDPSTLATIGDRDIALVVAQSQILVRVEDGFGAPIASAEVEGWVREAAALGRRDADLGERAEDDPLWLQPSSVAEVAAAAWVSVGSTVRVCASAPGFEARDATLVLEQARDHELVLRLQRDRGYTGIRFAFETPPGVELTDFGIEVESLKQGGSFLALGDRIEPYLGYRFAAGAGVPLAPGPYRVHVRPQSLQLHRLLPFSADVVVVKQQWTTVRRRLRESATLELQIEYGISPFNTTPFPIAFVDSNAENSRWRLRAGGAWDRYDSIPREGVTICCDAPLHPTESQRIGFHVARGETQEATIALFSGENRYLVTLVGQRATLRRLD